MRNKWSKYFWKLLWFVGLVALTYVSNELEQIVRNYGAKNFNMQPFIWFNAIVPCLLGIYISLLFIEGRSLKLNLSLLISVALPCFIFAFYGPIVYTMMASTATVSSSFSITIPPWMVNITNTSIVSMAAGLTLMVGLFGKKK